jgi:DNA repair protein RadA/Sms
MPIGEVDPAACIPTPTGIAEVDRVLSGGLVPGSVTLLGGEPGIGKSTLVLQIVASLAASGTRTLLVAAEEAAEQVRRRAERLGAVTEECYVMASNDLASALEAAGQLGPQLLVVDSIQALGDPSFSGRHGSTTQVRECAQALAHFAKATSTAVLLVGHVTKDGALAGPRTLEHLVDTVLSFEGDRHHSLRFLTATKHRFGAAGELGLFEMAETGLVALTDPSAILLADRRPGVEGAVVAPVIEGRRPLLVEVQALVSASRSTGRRVVQGIPQARLALLLAVLERSAGVATGVADVFVSTVGGIKVSEPGIDVAASLAVVSAITGIAVPEGVVAFGEIGLGGEIRQAMNPQRRLAEAERLGFDRAYAPLSTPQPGGHLDLVKVATVAELVAKLGLIDVPRLSRSRDRGRQSAAAFDPEKTLRKPKERPERPSGLSVVRD